MKKPIKRILISICCLAPVAFLTAFATSWVKDTPISIVGSSGVKPFSEALGKDYQKINDDIDITVDAGGSGFGIEQVAKGFASIGNASKDPYKAVKGTDEQNQRNAWEKNRIKTVTIGWEAICILYVPPIGLSNTTPEYLNKALFLSENNISYFYEAFSGWFGKNLKETPTLERFINTNVVTNQNDFNLFKQTKLLPYVRTGGGATSGTASSFSDKSHFSGINLTDEQIKAFKDGSYGKDFPYVETDEANSRAYLLFKSNNDGKRTPGSMVYLSSAFIESNREDEIIPNGFGIMAYQNGLEGSPISEYSVKNVQDGKYCWFRPLNSMVSLPEAEDRKAAETPAMKFLAWILFENEKDPTKLESAKDHNGLFTNTGGIPLTKKQFLSMCKEPVTSENFWKNFWTSDCEFLADKTWTDGKSFGAKE